MKKDKAVEIIIIKKISHCSVIAEQWLLLLQLHADILSMQLKTTHAF